MKKVLNSFVWFLICSPMFASAQQVPRVVMVEHFTNTYCSVCANRNPGFYNNLSNFPEIKHIAFHPSSPYAACPLNKHNKTENDGRTNYYGVFGGTPQLVINGNPIPPNSDYNSAALFAPYLDQTSSFDLKISLQQVDNATLSATIILKKVDTSSLTALNIYSIIAEDTLHFQANNGETLHHDIFRKSFVGINPVAINIPINVGDSVIINQTLPTNNAWDLQQCYAVAILSRADKQVEQSTTSEKLVNAITGINSIKQKLSYEIFPNPTGSKLYIKGDIKLPLQAIIADISGRIIQKQFIVNEPYSLDVSTLNVGTYLLRLQNQSGMQVVKFNKK